jgi:hypothetical protein
MAVWKKVTTHHGETLVNLDNVCWMTRVDNDTHIRFVGGATSNQKAEIWAKETPDEILTAPALPIISSPPARST